MSIPDLAIYVQEIEPANITLVDTAQALVNAVQAGALDIVVTEHLDLTTLPLLPTSICNVGCESPLGELSKTRSIRVSSLSFFIYFSLAKLLQSNYSVSSWFGDGTRRTVFTLRIGISR